MPFLKRKASARGGQKNKREEGGIIMIKYIAYCRKSTDEKEKQVLSIDQQVAELKEFAERENLEIVEFLTEAQSAKIPGRPIFNTLVKRIENGEVSGIVSWNPDRLARNSIDGGKIIYLLDLEKLQSLKFPTHWFENTPQGRFMLSIAFSQAKYYVDNLSQNVLRGLKYKIKEKGIWPAQAPLGYNNDRNTKDIVINPHEARIIRKGFELYATGKYSIQDICNYFFEQGIKNELTDGAPNNSNVRRILMRPFYYGYMKYMGELYKGTHHPLISKDLFDKVQIILKQRGWHHKPSKRYDFPFTGFIKCGYCDCFITAEHRPFYFPRTHNKVSYIYYHCTRKRFICGAKGYTRQEVLEKQFQEIIRSCSMSQKWADRMFELLESDAQIEKQQAKQELQKLTTELTEIEQRLDRLLEAYLDAMVESSNYKLKKNELMDKKSVIENRITRIKDNNPIWIERVKEFTFCALECAKIARAENNGHLLSQMAKKVGSKYFLKDQRIEFSLLPPYKALAASAGAASATASFDPALAFGQSKYYVDSLSENTKRGLRQKVRNGECLGQAPVGYLNDRLKKKMVIDPKVAPIIKELFEIYSKGNSTCKDLSLFLKSKGITSREGNPIHKSRVAFILSNPFYYGDFRFKGEIYQGIHEPLITKKLFDIIQKVMDDRGRSHPVAPLNFPFTGLIKCGECGMMISAEQHLKYYKSTNQGQQFIYYRCSKKSRVVKCSQPYITESAIIPQLNGHIKKVSLSTSDHKWFISRLESDERQQRSEVRGKVQEFKESLLNTNVNLNKLLDSYLDNVVSREDYLNRKEKFMSEKKTLEERIRTLELFPNKWLEPMREFFNDALEANKIASDNINLFQKREFLKKTGSNLTLKDRIVDCDLPEQWAALRAARQVGTKVSVFEQIRTHFKESC